MRNLLLLLPLFFALNACGDAEEQAKIQAELTKKANVAEAEKKALMAELKAKKDALIKARQETQAAKTKLLAEEKAKKEAFIKAQEQKEHQAIQNKNLAPAGININHNKITIDTNRTKDFFQKLGKTFEKKMTKLTEELEKGIVDEKEAGVHIDDTHINIDLNKTKKFLEQFGGKMQGFIKEFDGFAQKLDETIQTQRK